MKRKTHTDLIQDLIDAVYESGYYSEGRGRPTDHMKAMQRRAQLRRAVLERLKQGDKVADKLRSNIAELKRRLAETVPF